jgi:hypothetical protein
MIGKRHLYTKFKTQYYSFEVSIPIVTELLFFRNSFPNLNNKNSKLLVTHRKWKMLTHKFLHVTGPNLPFFWNNEIPRDLTQSFDRPNFPCKNGSRETEDKGKEAEAS